MNKAILERWKKLNIIEGKFQFDCGGDSMGDTELTFVDKDDNEFEDAELANYFHDEVYRNVTFYEASDGHYMGESGCVHITLDEDDFSYSKNAQSEFCETESGEVLVPITDDEYKVLTEYVRGMASSSWNGDTTDYKKDFILTDEIEKTIATLHEKFDDYQNSVVIETEGELRDDSYAYNTLEDDDATEMRFTTNESGERCIILNVTCEVYVYKDSD